jgi:TctA family transporter
MNSLRWALLGATEVIFWSGLVAFFALRYGLKRPQLSYVVLAFVIAEHVALLVFGLVDFARTGTWSLYQTVIAGILGYMLIWGRMDLNRLDGWVAQRVQRWQRSQR